MIARQARTDTGLGVSFVFSTVIHLAVFLLVLWLGRFAPQNMALQETYYVDVVNLPVADPRAGGPTQKGNDAEQAPPPMAPENPMSMPVPPKPGAKGKTAPPPTKGKTAEPESSAFAERMAKLESKAEAQQAEAALARIAAKQKNTGSGRSGMPVGKGTDAGSDYTAYIKSRLEDALEKTASYTSRNPEIEVRLFIDTDGKLTRRKTERSSGDRAFEISVLRAIELASDKFPPPPNHKMFNEVFVFRPKGIKSGKQ